MSRLGTNGTWPVITACRVNSWNDFRCVRFGMQDNWLLLWAANYFILCTIYNWYSVFSFRWGSAKEFLFVFEARFFLCFLSLKFINCPTDPSTISELQNWWYDVPELYEIRWFPNLEALEVRKSRLGDLLKLLERLKNGLCMGWNERRKTKSILSYLRKHLYLLKEHDTLFNPFLIVSWVNGLNNSSYLANQPTRHPDCCCWCCLLPITLRQTRDELIFQHDFDLLPRYKRARVSCPLQAASSQRILH